MNLKQASDILQNSTKKKQKSNMAMRIVNK